jgi:hypothetical protein
MNAARTSKTVGRSRGESWAMRSGARCRRCERRASRSRVLDRLGAAVSHLPLFGEFDSAAQLRCSSCGEGSARGQNSNAIYPGQRPGRVLRFLPPEVEKAQSEARSAHSVAAYTAAEMMCLPGHKGG